MDARAEAEPAPPARRRVLIAAGGTGGHVYPALAVADVLRDRGHHVAFAGGDRIEARIVPEAGYELFALPARALPRRPSVEALRSGAAFLRSVRQAREVLNRTGTDVVLGLGGYPSLAPSLAAGRAGLRVVLHEQNARLSLANRLSLRAADVLATSFPLEGRLWLRPRMPVVATGNPIRTAIVDLASESAEGRAVHRIRALRRWGLDPDRVTLLVFGGSLGARALNEGVPAALGSSSVRGAVQVLHVSGPDHLDDTQRAWRGSGVVSVVEPYVDRFEEAYAAADVVVSRAGASTVAELTALGLPSVVVPYPLAPGDAQGANARVLARSGAGRVVPQLEPELVARLRAAIDELVGEGGARASAASAARRLGRPDAAERVADLVAV